MSSLVAVLVGLGACTPLCAQPPTFGHSPNSAIPSAPSVQASHPLNVVDDEFAHPLATPWWEERMKQPVQPEKPPLTIDLESAVIGMLMYSPQVRVSADFPVIRETEIAGAVSEFDPRAFLDSKFVDTNDPVGNLLTTGGARRFVDQTMITSGGVRKSNVLGGQFEAAHRTGWQTNNSNFFIPKDQATSRITLNYTQPLLQGRGKLYNTSTICLAELNAQESTARLQSDLQKFILDTHRLYWQLYVQRAALLQRMRLKEQAVEIQRELRGRADFDVLQSQVVRADAAVATRDAAVIRYYTEVANAETKLRAHINDPRLTAAYEELIPILAPYREPVEPDLAQALTTALQHRPEIQAGFTEVRAAGLRAEVSKNNLLPVFNLVLGTYVSGLQGNSAFGNAWVDQFSVGRPTYWSGLQFEYPLYNRGPRAQRTARLVELRQATNRLQQTMIETRAETEVAAREVVTTYREMLSKYQAMCADRVEIDYLNSRRKLSIGDQQLAGVVLNDLLEAQERLADAELDFVKAEAAYNFALVNLNAVMGILLQTERVEMVDASCDGVPTIDVHAVPDPARAAAFAEPVPANSGWTNGANPALPQPPQQPLRAAQPMPQAPRRQTIPFPQAIPTPVPAPTAVPTSPSPEPATPPSPAIMPLPAVDSPENRAPESRPSSDSQPKIEPIPILQALPKPERDPGMKVFPSAAALPPPFASQR